MAYGSFHGGEEAHYVPGVGGDSLLDMLYEDAREQKDRARYQRYLSRICGIRCYDNNICLSVHGQDRREIRVMNVSAGVEDQDDVYTLTQHDHAVEELYCNYRANGADEKDMTSPLVAARCASSVDYFRLHIPLDGSSEPVMLKRIHGAATTGTVNGGVLRDFAWNQYVSSHGIVLEDSGMLFETDLSVLDDANYIPSSRRNCHVLDAKKKSPTDLSSMGATRCEPCALHPQLSMVAWHDALLKVDFREKSSLLPMTSKQSQHDARVLYDFSINSGDSKHTCVTSFATASRNSSVPHAYAASTPSHVYLFDVRKPSCPLVTWEHYSKFPSTRTTSWYDLKSSLPSNLQFVNTSGGGDALLLSNSFQGNAFLLQWKCIDEGEYIEFRDGKISYKKTIGENPTCDSQSLAKSSLHFAWKPISFQRFEPIKPPAIVYNHVHPNPGMSELLKWQEEMNFRNQDMIKCFDQNVRQLPPNNNQVCRDLGSCFMQRKWENNEICSDALLVRLGPFDELIIGSLDTSQHGGSFPAETSSDHLVFSKPWLAGQGRQDCSSVHLITEDDGPDLESNKINFESSGYTLAVDNQIRAPIHGTIFHQAQAEYNDTSSGNVSSSQDGLSREEIGLFLTEMLEQLIGIPVSAYEAWHILQRCIIEVRDDQKEDIKSLIDCISDHTYLFSRPITWKPIGNKRKERERSGNDSNELADFLRLKGFFPALSEHQNDIIAQERNIGPALSSFGWRPTSSLGPSPLFMDVWDSLESPGDRQILSWTLKSPTDLADILYFIGPLQPIGDLIDEVNRSRKQNLSMLSKSIVSMKALVEHSTRHISIQMADAEETKQQSTSTDAHDLLKKLQERWDKNKHCA